MMDQLQKHQEQYIQSRKMAAIGTLTSGIAHELNNPLNNICITTESLIDDLNDLSDVKKENGFRTSIPRPNGPVERSETSSTSRVWDRLPLYPSPS